MNSLSKNKKHKKTKPVVEKKDKEIETKIKKLEKERDEFLAYAQKCKADFLNHKKEEGQRIDKLIDYEKTGWFLDLLPILDHFELARQQTLKQEHNSSVFDGFFHIQKSLEKFLREQGLEEIACRIGEKFNPNFEEVIDTEEKEGEEGIILELIQKGYKFKDRIIRPVRVKVSVAPKRNEENKKNQDENKQENEEKQAENEKNEQV